VSVITMSASISCRNNEITGFIGFFFATFYQNN
jgi:hypothetical protein